MKAESAQMHMRAKHPLASKSKALPFLGEHRLNMKEKGCTAQREVVEATDKVLR